MSEPRHWTLEELELDAAEATNSFRERRLLEPLELYSQAFEHFAPLFRELITEIPELAKEADASRIPQIVAGNDTRTAFRYLTAPPISESDLVILAETNLSSKALRRDPENAKRVRDIVLRILDPHRFPWIAEARKPSEHELKEAITASAALVAAKKVETARRNDAKKDQEDLVKSALAALGFKEVPPRDIPLPHEAPTPGEFCGESKFGSTRGDIIVRLHDQRIMPIECKVSNSAVNSYKRVNHEAANKARQWLADFGKATTVPAAVLSGVFNPANLLTAQAAGLALIWAHRIEDLTDFIVSAK